MPGLVITLSGSSTPYEQMLARSVTQAKAAGVAIQREYERTQAIIGRRISPIQSMEAMNPASTLINKQAITSAEQDYVAFWETTLAAKAAADAEQVAMNQAKLETIMAQEKAAGVEYESDRAAQLAAEDILYHEEVAAKAAADTQKSLYNAITLAKIEKQEADALAAKKLMDEEMVASNRAANLAMLADSAKGNFGQGIHGTGAGGGISGIMREIGTNPLGNLW